MTKGISIGVGADTRQFSQAVARGIVDPLEDVEKALDGIGKDKAGDKLEDSMKDAQRATERLADEQKSLGDVIARESERGGRALKRNISSGTSAAKRDLEELKNEAKQNASETFSSFDGSLESFADGLQGTFGGVVSGLGPIGAAAGAAGALGIGLIMAAFGTASEDTEAYKERVAALAQEFIDTGTDGEASIDFLVSKLQELATETDDVGLKELAKIAAGAKSDFKDLAQAYAGNTDGLRDLWREADRQVQKLKDEANALNQTTAAGQARAAQIVEQIGYQEQYRDKIGQSIGVAEEAATAEQNYIDAGGRAMETRAAAQETYQSALDDSIGAFGDFTNAETGALDPAAYVAGIQARIDATANFNTNVQELATQFGLTDAEVQAILDQGLDFAPMLQSIKDAGLEGEFVAKLQAAVGGGQEILDGNPLSTTADVDADTSEAESKTDAFTNTKRDTTITAKADTAKAEADIRATAAAPYSAVIAVGADLSQATADISAWTSRRRTITITADVVDRAGKPID